MIPILLMRKKNIEKLNNLTKVSQLIIDRARTKIKAISLQIPEILIVRFIIDYQVHNTFMNLLSEIGIYRMHF